jgi:hypothetical protein
MVNDGETDRTRDGKGRYSVKGNNSRLEIVTEGFRQVVCRSGVVSFGGGPRRTKCESSEVDCKGITQRGFFTLDRACGALESFVEDRAGSG